MLGHGNAFGVESVQWGGSPPPPTGFKRFPGHRDKDPIAFKPKAYAPSTNALSLSLSLSLAQRRLQPPPPLRIGWPPDLIWGVPGTPLTRLLCVGAPVPPVRTMNGHGV